MKKVSQKFLSLILAICLCFTMLPMSSASAAVTAMAWTYVGDSGFAQYANQVSLAVSDSGISYMACLGYHNKVASWKFDGTKWAGIGNVSNVANNSSPAIALDGGGTPYVAYIDYSKGNKATVMKYSGGTSWGLVGGSAVSPGTVRYPSIVVDSGNTPYVAYTDGSKGNKATVKKFDGTSWVSVGDEGFSSGEADYISLAIDQIGTPYVSYTDPSNGKKGDRDEAERRKLGNGGQRRHFKR